jgi:hypothetical protein
MGEAYPSLPALAVEQDSAPAWLLRSTEPGPLRRTNAESRERTGDSPAVLAVVLS